VGERVFEDKWGAPDVIGIERSTLGEIIQRQVVIVSAEIKIDTQGLITALDKPALTGSLAIKHTLQFPRAQMQRTKKSSIPYVRFSGLVLFSLIAQILKILVLTFE
jgi:hypothetical protein